MTTQERPLRVGLVGCGKISEAYLRAGYHEYAYVACADLDEARAVATAETYRLQPMPVSELLSHPEVDIVCNLTVPLAHYDIS
ncbi:MAG TPA: Gfo/Idh/MocA family oxidoreductase, partial [Acidimicrobiales bacterium]|nr:Gfo/Idh/MocA family oxidoreductase [Acidimicrobiales bacterium]